MATQSEERQCSLTKECSLNCNGILIMIYEIFLDQAGLGSLGIFLN